MTLNDDPSRVWRLIPLLSAYNEEAGLPGAPPDVQSWLRRHLQRWPEAFAYEDWSGSQPAMRKIALVRMEEQDA